MQITLSTKIHELITSYPFLMEYLTGRAREFEKLRNPLLLNSLGRVATIKDAAAIAKLSPETLLDEIVSEIARNEALASAPAAAADRPARIAAMKSIIRDLHAGKDKDLLKRRFAMVSTGVDPVEIAAMEQELAAEGLSPDEIRKMCDIHVEIFRDAIRKGEGPGVEPGHPVHTFTAENRLFRETAEKIEALIRAIGTPPAAVLFESRRHELQDLFDRLVGVEKHYLRKENQLFPFLERHGIVAPTQVMWAVHDEIRGALEEVISALAKGDAAVFSARGPLVVQAVLDMIFKEERILFPMALETLTRDEWEQVRRGEADLGYAVAKPEAPAPEPKPAVVPEGTIPLDTGALSAEQLNLLLRNLPLDVTFVDEHDEVRYYSAGRERIFPRSPGVIGRKVQNCHPPKSLGKVNEILDGFRDGSRNVAEFWIQFDGRFIHIRYFALRDARGGYRGCIEVTQDVTEIRHLQGQRRLLE